MGIQVPSFFLSAATCNAATSEWPPHLFAKLDVPVFDSSTPWPLILSRRGTDDSLPESAALLLRQCVLVSTDRLSSRLSRGLSAVFFLTLPSLFPQALVVAPGWALTVSLLPLPDGRLASKLLWNSKRPRRCGRPLYKSYQTQVRKSPAIFSFLIVVVNQLVSYFKV